MQPDDKDKNRIEDLNQSIYSRNAPDIRTRRKMHFDAEPQGIGLKTDWQHPDDVREEVTLNDSYIEQKHSMSFFSKLLIGSAIFCVIAVGVGAFIFFNGGNFISGDNIAVTISGPVSVPGGTPVSLAITVTNNNSVALHDADLTVHFPAGTTDPRDTTTSLEEHEEKLGDLSPNESVTKTVDAVIFGEENLQKKITAIVTYGVAGSSSVFTKETSYDVVVNSSPLVVSVTSPKEITSGQPFDMVVSVKSNSTNTLKNVLLKAMYPFGFSFDSASVRPASSDNTVWSLGDMPPGGSRSITIHGKLTGEDTDLRAFHFSVGARSAKNPLAIGTIFMETEQDLTIQKPIVSLSISIDNDSDPAAHVGQFDRAENVNIRWTNNLSETLSNVVIMAHLSGSAYDKAYVSAYTGFFRSATDDIVWNQQTNPELASVSAGSSGVVSFSMTPVNRESGQIQNPNIVISGTVTGSRTANINAPLATAPVDRNIKITSNVSLSGRVVRSSGPFVNSGPIPPVAEQKTTYTVTWSVDNTSNSVGSAYVTSTVPPYVTWTGQISPPSEDVSYDKNSGTITWNIGNVNAFTIGGSGRREVSFQLAIQPSIDQVGQSPTILNQATLTAVDSWTKTNVQSTQGYLTTSFSTDPTFKPGDGTVVKP